MAQGWALPQTFASGNVFDKAEESGQHALSTMLHQQSVLNALQAQRLHNAALPDLLELKKMQIPAQIRQKQEQLALGAKNLQFRKKSFPLRSLYGLAKISTTPAGESLTVQSEPFAKTLSEGIVGAIQQIHPAAQHQLLAGQRISSMPAAHEMPALPQQVPIDITPDMIKNIQDVTRSRIIKKTVPTTVQKQRYFSKSLNNLFNQADFYIPSVVKFAGLSGRAHQTVEEFAAANNLTTSPDYKKYNTFVTSKVPIIANEILRNLGSNATIPELEKLNALSNPATWRSNPQLALASWNALKDSITGVDEAISQSPAQIEKGISQRVNPVQRQNLESEIKNRRVKVKDKNGKIGSIPAAQLSRALRSGYKEIE